MNSSCEILFSKFPGAKLTCDLLVYLSIYLNLQVKIQLWQMLDFLKKKKNASFTGFKTALHFS